MFKRISGWTSFLIILFIGALFATWGPPEQSLGSSVRSVYLHGAWVWTALIEYAAAACVGLAALFLRRKLLHRWSIALGRTATFFWITYLPLSLMTMQMNWNGIYLDEPRWRLGVNFAIVGILLQAAIWVIRRPAVGSAINVLFAALLGWSLLHTQQIMHPSSPIMTSDSVRIRSFFIVLLILFLHSGWFFTQGVRQMMDESNE